LKQMIDRKAICALFVVAVFLVSVAAVTHPAMAKRPPGKDEPNVMRITPTLLNNIGSEYASIEFSSTTTLGENYVNMSIDSEWVETSSEGLNIEVRRHGIGQLESIAANPISFKVFVTAGSNVESIFIHSWGGSSPLYVTIILHIPSQDLWVSLIPSARYGPNMTFSSEETEGWITATPAVETWVGWTFLGQPFGGTYDGGMPIHRTLSEWNTYLNENYPDDWNIDKVNIQFGYQEYAGDIYGTVYVDALQVSGHIYDFEP